MGHGFAKLTTSVVLSTMLIASPANALIHIDQQVCPSYDTNNVGRFFDRDETYLSGIIIDAGTYGLLNKKHPKNIAIQKTNESEGLFYQLYKIKPLIAVKSDREIQLDVPITVLDLSGCGECNLKAIRSRRASEERQDLPLLFKLIPVRQVDAALADKERLEKFPWANLKIFAAVISSFKTMSVIVDYILVDPCNLYRVDSSGSSDVIESYQKLMK